MSGVPQGSLLGPLLYVNDLDDNITCNVLKLADDTKVFRRVNNDKQHLQNNGHGNLDVHYKMRDTVLGTAVKEKDIGVITISADMKGSEQCCIAASKGNQILGLIRRNITHKEKSQLYLCIKQ